MPDDMYCVKCKYHLKGLNDHCCPECGHTFEPDNPMTYLQCPWVHRRVNIIIGLVLLILVLVWGAIGSGDFTIFVDRQSLIWVIGIVSAGLWMCFGPVIVYHAITTALSGARHQNRGWYILFHTVLARGYQLSWAAGLSGSLIGIIIMCRNMDDPSALGPGISVGLLSVLYGLILAEFIFSPLQQVMASRANTVIDCGVGGPSTQRSMLAFGVSVMVILGMLTVIGFVALLP